MVAPAGPADERLALVDTLKKELLGPRDGVAETMPVYPETGDPADPAFEYSLGVLDPATDSTEGHNPESEAATLELSATDHRVESSTDVDGPWDQPPEPGVGLPPPSLLASPTLDGRLRPRSLGMSFVVAGSERPKLDILVTYAVYRLEAGQWHRVPLHRLFDGVDARSSAQWDLVDGAAPGVTGRVYFLSTPHSGPSTWRVSIYFVNNTELPKGTEFHRRSSFRIFQPQIRVNLVTPARLVPLGIHTPAETTLEDSEAAHFALRSAFARGHLCGVTWKEIDYSADASHPQWRGIDWPDAEAVPEHVRDRFESASVRTDFIPAYHVSAPDFSWRSPGRSPVLEARALAALHDPVDLRRALEPLADGYHAWIEGHRIRLQRRQSAGSEEALDACSSSERRIRVGIERLVGDDRARLAFCFANQAIFQQNEWRAAAKGGSGAGFQWRPFQLAFLLLALPSVVDKGDPDRQICDLLWIPTGGGKTEAYLGLVAFTLALRRLRAPAGGKNARAGFGTGVLSRYTLRLLTIQQFRRTAGLITACEYLRVVKRADGRSGWSPEGLDAPDQVWGNERFSLGLWVGGDVTPNGLGSFDARPERGGMLRFVGAFELLQGAAADYSGPNTALAKRLQNHQLIGLGSEPAQLVRCPACDSLLAIPASGLLAGSHQLHLVVRAPNGPAAAVPPPRLPAGMSLSAASLSPITGADPIYRILTLEVDVAAGAAIRPEQFDAWFAAEMLPLLGRGAQLEAARASRMGYFLIEPPSLMPTQPGVDFAVYCASPVCPLGQTPWSEQAPFAFGSRDSDPDPSGSAPLVRAFQSEADGSTAVRVPIPVYTVDDQVYARCPSVIIATVDKFARLAHEPRAASMFGNVEYYHSLWGHYREGVPPSMGQLPSAARAHPATIRGWGNLRIAVEPFDPPDLIIQDELHLIEGPLGSMVGAYEVLIDDLCSVGGEHPIGPKYVASSATVNAAESQVEAVFDRSLRVFPPPGPLSGDDFFTLSPELHPGGGGAGRLYLGVACPGWGALTPVVRIWTTLLQKVHADMESGVPSAACDPFWTLVGYFNAIRELSAARALYRGDIQERLRDPLVLARLGGSKRPVAEDVVEASGRTDSIELPQILEQLDIGVDQGDAIDSLVTTSMFGTGVDIQRLSLMVVHGQPKTTSSYIQATGRVGRGSAGLVVTLLRPTRSRDLDHYEFFTGYHRALQRWVEPVTVTPFAPRARERVLGPVQVALLRQEADITGTPVPSHWRREQRLAGRRFDSSAYRMASERLTPIMARLGELLERRSQTQPLSRRPAAGLVEAEAGDALDRWRSVAARATSPNDVVYAESAALRSPTRHVILGDAAHARLRLLGLAEEAFPNAPQSLREVDGTTGVWVP